MVGGGGAKENPTTWAGEVRLKLEDASTSKSNESGSSFTALMSQVKGVAVHAALVMEGK